MFTPDGLGRYVLTLAVNDGAATHQDSVNVDVVQVNVPPVPNAGPDRSVHLGQTATLRGTGSDPDGPQPLSFAWTLLAKPADSGRSNADITDANTTTPSFKPDLTGEYLLKLKVSDGQDSSVDNVVITAKNDPPLCSQAQAVPDLLWPANHNMVSVNIAGVSDPDDDAFTIRIVAVTQDEPVNGLGDGDTSPDAVIQGDKVLLRAERSGTGNGRVYEVGFTAEDGYGGTCVGSVKVKVPHSKKPGALVIDDGQLYDSTQP
jgi:hypothetical protein